MGVTCEGEGGGRGCGHKGEGEHLPPQPLS